MERELPPAPAGNDAAEDAKRHVGRTIDGRHRVEALRHSTNDVTWFDGVELTTRRAVSIGLFSAALGERDLT
ncbi:hypothetical protein L6R52_24060, partial [Myxococcota bacterium]|nr:hypothetical protein [Myxococcota bacterium]